jgi:cell division protein FtsA
MMSQKQDNLIAVLDLGSASTRVLVAEVNEGALRYCGHGVVESAGMRKGLIGELAPAIKAVKAANAQAERMAGVNVGSCVVGVGGMHVKGINSSDGVELGVRVREIENEDVRNVVERTRAIERPPDRYILHLLPRQFILDEQPGIFDPIGMVGKRLDVDLHIVTCSTAALQSTVTCANRAGIEVSDAVLESVAAAEATLTSDERELGVLLLNIGGHSSDLVVFHEGAVVHTGSVPIGGAHFTNDIAVGLQIPVAQAEELKREFGHAVVTSVPQDAEIEIANPQPRILRLRALAEILEPRARELFYFVKENLRKSDLAETLRLNDAMDVLGSGTVLTGGGAILPGMLDVAESQLRVPARNGLPVRLSKMPGDLVHPAWTTAVGMILYAHRIRVTRAADNNTLRAKLRAIFAASY